MANSEKQYIDLYKGNRNVVDAHGSVVMNAVRDKAMADFERLGFPFLKDEKYRYTDVDKVFSDDYGLNIARLAFPVNPYEAFKCDVPNLSTQLYFMENDMFYTGASGVPAFDQGIFVGSLKQASEIYPELVAKYYAKAAETSSDAITALNTAFAQDGMFVYVPKNVKLSKTVQVVNILRSDVDMMVNRRVLVVLEEGAEATLLFCDHAADSVRFLTTQIVEVYCGDNSHLDMYELEETHVKCSRFSNMYVHAGRDCSVNLNNITLYNGLTRNTTCVAMEGEGSEVVLNGCVIADKNQHVDNNTLIDHRVPHCTSRELYKYVLDDSAVGAFAGKILVREGAQKTSSQETNANLCATNDARMYTQPMLEIYADDVKCAHGATVGQLDERAMFYMQQRGISREEARMMLMFAFVGQVIDEIKLEPLRDRLHHLVEKRFRGELSKCAGCGLCRP